MTSLLPSTKPSLQPYNSFEHECLEEAVALLGATSRPDAPADQIQVTKYFLEQFPSVTFLAHQIWGIWFIV